MSSNTRRDKIIKQNEVFLMNDLNDQYIAILSELSGEQENFLENIRQLYQQQRLWRQKHLEKSKSKRVKQEEEVWSIATIQQLKKGKSTKHEAQQ